MDSLYRRQQNLRGGLAAFADPTRFLVTDQRTGTFYEIDPVTEEITREFSTDLEFQDGLAVVDGLIYASDQENDELRVYRRDGFQAGTIQLPYPVGGVAGGQSATGTGNFTPDIDVYTVDLSGRVGNAIDIVLAGDSDFGTSEILLIDPAGNVVAEASRDPLASGIGTTNFLLGISGFTVPTKQYCDRQNLQRPLFRLLAQS